MNKADREIIKILKETFRRKKGELYDPDDLMREGFIKGSLVLSLISISVCVVSFLATNETPEGMKLLASGPIGIFFGVLFFQLNLKSENPSVILFALTWISMMLGFWF